MYTEDFCHFLPLWVLRLCRGEAEARVKFCKGQVGEAGQLYFPYRNNYELEGTERIVNLRGARQDLETCEHILDEKMERFRGKGGRHREGGY
jgi:hypothetical protein